MIADQRRHPTRSPSSGIDNKVTRIGVADKTAVECAKPTWANAAMTIMISTASRIPRTIWSTGRVVLAAAFRPPRFRAAS